MFTFHFHPSPLVGIEWSRVISEGRIPSPRSYHSAVIVDGEVFTFGGYDGRFYLNDLHKWTLLDHETNQLGSWKKLDQQGIVPEVR